jgi:transposase
LASAVLEASAACIVLGVVPSNRQLNSALYRIAIVQARHHPDARAYLARKASEGKTPREARRALKRHLANVLYRRLCAWAEQTPAMQT